MHFLSATFVDYKILLLKPSLHVLDGAVNLLGLSGLSDGWLHRVTVSDDWWLVNSLLSNGTLTGEWLLDCMLSSDTLASHGLLNSVLTSDRLLVALLSYDTLTGDGLLLSTGGESLLLGGNSTSSSGGTGWGDG